MPCIWGICVPPYIVDVFRCYRVTVLPFGCDAVIPVLSGFLKCVTFSAYVLLKSVFSS